MVNQGGSWVGFVEGNESFKMVVVESKKSTGVGRNRPWKMDPHDSLSLYASFVHETLGSKQCAWQLDYHKTL
ncbi:S2-RNase [Pyrus ussuriensis x Pyrus communis]|uniref:S2-RNase n=1 Tax=Pyrus ussuriensis x Pyrus communis TaxID=2448454 RepID=A0A5N5H8V0_9ROSA|nr:S2-RNase [Pyrus ussuriensis x Pyrus communis]